MKPKNFPERKRLRQLSALARVSNWTAGKPEKGIAPKPNASEITTLRERTATPKRDVRTKKDRSKDGRFARFGAVS